MKPFPDRTSLRHGQVRHKKKCWSADCRTHNSRVLIFRDVLPESESDPSVIWKLLSCHFHIAGGPSLSGTLPKWQPLRVSPAFHVQSTKLLSWVSGAGPHLDHATIKTLLTLSSSFPLVFWTPLKHPISSSPRLSCPLQRFTTTQQQTEQLQDFKLRLQSFSLLMKYFKRISLMLWSMLVNDGVNALM